jgi:hypothetical protein
MQGAVGPLLKYEGLVTVAAVNVAENWQSNGVGLFWAWRAAVKSVRPNRKAVLMPRIVGQDGV